MHVMKRFTLTFAAMTGLGIAPLIGQTPSLQTVPLSADIDVVNVRTLPDGNTLRQERKMKFYRRADGSTRVEEAKPCGHRRQRFTHRHRARHGREGCAGPEPLHRRRRTVGSQSRLYLNLKLPGAA